MPGVDRLLISTAYLPPLFYLQAVSEAEEIIVEADENFRKQSLRNRCFIAGANGRICLTVPVSKAGNAKVRIRDLKIDYNNSWQRQHIHSIKSAYGKSPYFIYYADQLFEILNREFKFLIDLNTELLNWMTMVMNEGRNILPQLLFKLDFFDKSDIIDLDIRNLSDIKNPDSIPSKTKPYTQVFQDRFGFTSGISAIDLLFNEGKRSHEYFEEL